MFRKTRDEIHSINVEFHGSTTLVGIHLLIVEVPRSHSRHTTIGRTPLDEWWARRRNLYLTTHNAQETDIHAPAGFEPAVPLGERPQTHAVDRAATGIGEKIMIGKCELSKSKLRNFLQAPVTSFPFGPLLKRPPFVARSSCNEKDPYKLIYLILYFSRYVSRHMMRKRKFNWVLARIPPNWNSFKFFFVCGENAILFCYLMLRMLLIRYAFMVVGLYCSWLSSDDNGDNLLS